MDREPDHSLASASPEQKLHWLTAELRTPVEIIRGLAGIIRLNSPLNNLEPDMIWQIANSISQAADKITSLLDDMVRSKGFYTPSKNLSSTDILLTLRQQLLNAREQNDTEMLRGLAIVFGIIEESATQKNVQGGILGIVAHLETSAFEAMHGIPWKSTIPSEEEIISALNSN